MCLLEIIMWWSILFCAVCRFSCCFCVLFHLKFCCGSAHWYSGKHLSVGDKLNLSSKVLSQHESSLTSSCPYVADAISPESTAPKCCLCFSLADFVLFYRYVVLTFHIRFSDWLKMMRGSLLTVASFASVLFCSHLLLILPSLHMLSWFLYFFLRPEARDFFILQLFWLIKWLEYASFPSYGFVG